MDNFGDQQNSAKLEDVKQCPDCGNWMQLRDTGFGNAWAHVKVDGNHEMLSGECFPEDKVRNPKLGETVVVIDSDGAEYAAIVSWVGAEDQFTAYVLPHTVYSKARSANVSLARYKQRGEPSDYPTANAEALGWRRP